MITVTANTVTDDQIRDLRRAVTAELHAGGWPPLEGYDAYTKLSSAQHQCDVALGIKRARRGSSRKIARERCADLINARTKPQAAPNAATEST